jgi:SAM-dependent methyltransferase
MSEAAFHAKIAELAPAAGGLAVLGAALRLRRDGKEAPRALQPALDEVLAMLGAPPLDGLEGEAPSRLCDRIAALLRHALDLLDNPARPTGWSFTDAALLEAQGGSSRLVPHLIAAAAKTRPDLAAVLDRPGVFLDIGTGVAQLAIEAARLWPALRVVAIDIWDPSIAIARRNIAASQLEKRIELRKEDATLLADRAAFSLVWLPALFFSGAMLDRALERIRRALGPDAVLVCGLESRPQAPLARALADLRTIRGGGELCTPEDVAARVEAAGYTGVEIVPGPMVTLILGRPPR